MKVTWVGGPLDGEEFTVPDGTRSITVAKPINLYNASEHEWPHPLVPLTPNHRDLPIYLTSDGYRVKWPY